MALPTLGESADTDRMEYRIGQVAEKVHRSTHTVRIWVAKGKMPYPTSVGERGEYRWDEDVINDWLNKRRNSESDHPSSAPPAAASA